MTLVDVDLATEPPSLKGYTQIPGERYPFCLLGFQIKSSYDEQRLQLKSKHNAKDYVHVLPNSQKEMTFFRGIKVTPRQELLPLLSRLESFNVSLNDTPHKHYAYTLNEYGLTCKNCYSHYQRGIYPIDGECINQFAREDIDLNELYASGFDTKLVPHFQSYAYFTIFILENKSIFKR